MYYSNWKSPSEPLVFGATCHVRPCWKTSNFVHESTFHNNKGGSRNKHDYKGSRKDHDSQCGRRNGGGRGWSVMNVAAVPVAEGERNKRWSQSNKTQRREFKKEEIDNTNKDACYNLWLYSCRIVLSSSASWRHCLVVILLLSLSLLLLLSSFSLLLLSLSFSSLHHRIIFVPSSRRPPSHLWDIVSSSSRRLVILGVIV